MGAPVGVQVLDVDEQALVVDEVRPGVPGRDVQLDQPIARHAEGDDVLDARDRVVTEQGELRPHINVFVGEESIRSARGFDTPVPPECEIAILPAVSGG